MKKKQIVLSEEGEGKGLMFGSSSLARGQVFALFFKLSVHPKETTVASSATFGFHLLEISTGFIELLLSIEQTLFCALEGSSTSEFGFAKRQRIFSQKLS